MSPTQWSGGDCTWQLSPGGGPRAFILGQVLQPTWKLGLLHHRVLGSPRASFTWAISTATSADSETLNSHKDQIVFLNLPVMLPVFRFLMVS